MILFVVCGNLICLRSVVIVIWDFLCFYDEGEGIYVVKFELVEVDEDLVCDVKY